MGFVGNFEPILDTILDPKSIDFGIGFWIDFWIDFGSVLDIDFGIVIVNILHVS